MFLCVRFKLLQPKNQTIYALQKLPMVQLSAVKPAAQTHDPSVCRHVSGLQFGEHTLEQFLPKNPSEQAR